MALHKAIRADDPTPAVSRGCAQKQKQHKPGPCARPQNNNKLQLDMTIKTKLLYLLLPLMMGVLASCGNDKTTSGAAAAEPHRPVYHFTPKAHWMNDPNGMVYYDGEYHLFFQYYPDSTVWGPMHWGHAVSQNLTDWEELPIALYPDSLGYIFSGSAVVDWKNTSGFGVDGQPPLVAMFTYHNMAFEKAGRTDTQYQGIAYSNDRGRTWTKYAANPVIPNPGLKDFRDPKLIWDAARSRWLMALAAYDRVKFYTSPNLKDWTHLSDFGEGWGAHGGVWECPDFFPMVMDGGVDTSWVLLLSINPGGPNGGSATQYFVGNFDGQTFKLDPKFASEINEPGKAIWLDWGRDNYAGVTWSDISTSDGRRIFLGWMSNWDYSQVVPTQTWRSAMTVPRSLSLTRTSQGPRLACVPVEELKLLRGKQFILENQQVEGELDLTDKLGFAPTAMEIVLEAELPATGAVDAGIALSNAKGETYRLGYDPARLLAYSDRTKAGKTDFSPKFATGIHTAPRAGRNGKLRWHIYLDRASCELFAEGGQTCLTDVFFPNEDFSRLSIYTKSGPIQITRAEFYELRKVASGQ